MRRLDSTPLATRIERNLLDVGVSPDSARHVTDSMVETSLRGVDSHGINLFPHYHRAVGAGRINGAPSFDIAARRPSAILLDADDAFGHHAGAAAIDLAIEMADETGIGAVAVRNSTHFGAAGYFALRAARRGYAAFSFTNADALVKAANGRAPVFGTNPVCFAAPMAGEDPFILDMATSLTSWNKVRNHRNADEALPPGWACDERGEPTTDPHAARMLEPAGGYKGYGLGMMVEILCGMLAGGPIAHELLPMFTTPLETKRYISHFFAALRVDAFQPVDAFAQRLTDLAAHVRGLESAGAPVQIPGDPEKRTFEDRKVSGIPVGDAVFAEYVAIDPDFEEVVLT